MFFVRSTRFEAREPEEGSDCPRPGPSTIAKTQEPPRVERKIEMIASPELGIRNRLQIAVGSEHGSALYPLT